MNPAERVRAAGQSIWLDSINRAMVTSGTLARYVEDLAVTGLTSNPTILGHAMAASMSYRLYVTTKSSQERGRGMTEVEMSRLQAPRRASL